MVYVVMSKQSSADTPVLGGIFSNKRKAEAYARKAKKSETVFDTRVFKHTPTWFTPTEGEYAAEVYEQW